MNTLWFWKTEVTQSGAERPGGDRRTAGEMGQPSRELSPRRGSPTLASETRRRSARAPRRSSGKQTRGPYRGRGGSKEFQDHQQDIGKYGELARGHRCVWHQGSHWVWERTPSPVQSDTGQLHPSRARCRTPRTPCHRVNCST